MSCKCVICGSSHIEGVVKNYKEYRVKGFFLRRVFQSMFTWTPYVPDGTMQTFQLYEKPDQKKQNQFEPVCQEVIIYGQVVRGMIHDDNVVRVWGRQNRHNVIEARTVKNLSSGTVMKTHHAIHPLIMWILLISFLASLLYCIPAIVGAMERKASSFFSQLPMGLFLISIFVLLAFLMAKSIFKELTFGGFLIIIFVIIAFIAIFKYPILTPLVLLIFILMFVLKRNNKD